MRVHANGFRFDGIRAAAIEETVAKVTGVRTVRAYPRTGSVVIRYSPAVCDTAAVLSAITDAEHAPAASVRALSPRSADVGNGGIVGKVIGGIGRMLLGRRRDDLDRPPEIERLRRALDHIGCQLESVTPGESSPAEETVRQRRTWLRRVWLAWPFGLLVFGAVVCCCTVAAVVTTYRSRSARLLFVVYG